MIMMKKTAISLFAFFLLLVSSTAWAVSPAEEAKVSTTRTFQVGSFVAYDDGLTPVTTVTLLAMDEKALCPPNGAACQLLSDDGNSWTAVTSADGDYNVTIADASMETLGRYTFVFNDDDVFLPTRCYLDVVSANFWNNKYGTTVESVGVSTILDASDEVQAAALAALTEYDPPTDTEMEAAHSTTDGLINDASDEVQAAAALALTAYDPPTNSEMDTGHGLLATEAKQDIIDQNVDDIESDTGAVDTTTKMRTFLTGSDTAVSTLTEDSNVGLDLSDTTGELTSLDFSPEISGMTPFQVLGLLLAKAAGANSRTVDGVNYDLLYYAVDDDATDDDSVEVIELQDVNSVGVRTGAITITDPL